MKRFAKTAVLVMAFLTAGFAAYVYMTNRPLAQDRHDVAIVERTMVLLRDESSWSRAGGRSCDQSEYRLNLYCALKAASIEVAGVFKHRSAAMQEVRRAIEAQNPGADYAHRLMDYNNDPATDFADIHAVLEEALASLRARPSSLGK